jgi:hypothetical protein
MNQANKVQIIGHGGEMCANGVQSDKETAVFHNRNLEAETNRRTMNFQRTANCVLTVCLNRGGRRRLCTTVERQLFPIRLDDESLDALADRLVERLHSRGIV